MHLGALLVLIGTIFAAVALLLGYAPRSRGSAFPTFAFLAIGVVLIGIGVLVGNTVLSS